MAPDAGRTTTEVEPTVDRGLHRERGRESGQVPRRALERGAGPELLDRTVDERHPSDTPHPTDEPDRADENASVAGPVPTATPTATTATPTATTAIPTATAASPIATAATTADITVTPEPADPHTPHRTAALTRAVAYLGAGPVLVLMALGVVVVAHSAGAVRGARSVADLPAAYVFGMLLVVVPAVVGATAPRVSRFGPAALAVTGAAFVELAHLLVWPTPFLTDTDLVRLLVLRRLEGGGQVFDGTSLAPALAAYPGLDVVTNAVTSLTGLSDATAAALVLGAARLLLSATLFLLVAHLTRSQRIGAVAVLLYAATTPLADPTDTPTTLAAALVLLVAYVVVSRRRRRAGPLLGVAVTLAAVGLTDHAATVLATTALVLWFALELVLRKGRQRSALALGALASVAVLVLVLESAHTLVLTGSLPAGLILGADSPVSWTADGAPTWAVVLAVGSVVLTAAAAVVALVRAKLFLPTHVSLAVLLGVAAVLDVVVLAGHVLSGAAGLSGWAGPLLGAGTAFAIAWWLLQRRPTWRRATVVGLGSAVVLAGSLVGGVARVSSVSVDDADLAAASRWMGGHLPAGTSVYAGPTASLVLALDGRQVPAAGLPGISSASSGSSALDPDGPETDIQDPVALRAQGIRYVLVDRRREQGTDVASALTEDEGVATVYDNGAVVLLDLGGSRA